MVVLVIEIMVFVLLFSLFVVLMWMVWVRLVGVMWFCLFVIGISFVLCEKNFGVVYLFRWICVV